MNIPSPIVLATRPQQQNTGWCKQLLEVGYRVVDMPLLAIEPMSDETSICAITARVLKLDEYDYCIFVSQNAVSEAFKWIDRYWPQLPNELQCLGIGKKTAYAIASCIDEQGGDSRSIVDSVGEALTSEALLELPCLQDVSDKKMLIFRGCGGRTKIQDVLAERGAHVASCELYARKKLRPSFKQKIVISQQGRAPVSVDTEQSINSLVVPLFSGETLSSFYDLAREEIVNWQSIPLVLPSKRVAEIARTMNFNYIIVADNAAESSMLSALETIQG